MRDVLVDALKEAIVNKFVTGSIGQIYEIAMDECIGCVHAGLHPVQVAVKPDHKTMGTEIGFRAKFGCLNRRCEILCPSGRQKLSNGDLTVCMSVVIEEVRSPDGPFRTDGLVEYAHRELADRLDIAREVKMLCEPPPAWIDLTKSDASWRDALVEPFLPLT